MVSEKFKKIILKKIEDIEAKHDIKVLYAIESGSRAWGFSSPDSDYDIRFIYIRKIDWYLSINPESFRDVIECPILDELDINGWDIQKGLKLLLKSNPTFIEWLNSPIIYKDEFGFAASCRQSLKKIFSIDRSVYHYLSIARTNYQKFGSNKKVSIKKYFYIMRSLLSIKWVETFKEPAPIEFQVLREMIENTDLNMKIDLMLKNKISNIEQKIVPQSKVINKFIEFELSRLEGYTQKSVNKESNISELNELFREILDRTKDC